MKLKSLLISASLFLSLVACVGEDVIEDFVNPELRIRNPIASLDFNENYQYEARYLNNIGLPEDAAVVWTSSDETVISINPNTGQATALKAGEATITATFPADGLSTTTVLRVIGGAAPVDEDTDGTDEGTEEPDGTPDEGTEEPGDEAEEPDGEVGGGTEEPEEPEEVVEETVAISRNGVIASTSSYRLRGDFTLMSANGGALSLSLDQNYEASTSLPGLYVYLTNNPNSINGALEIGKVAVFQGAHSYVLPSNVAITDYSYVMYWCKPFSVKVGGGDIVE